MRIPVAIDPLETVEVEFWPEALKAQEHGLTISAERARAALDEEAAKDAEAALAEVRAELAAYVPGSGPVVIIGMIPGEKRATLGGMAEETSTGSLSERMGSDFRWMRAVVKAAIRGHRGLKGRGGVEVPFDAEPMALAGASVPSPTERQIEAYAAAGMLGTLASLAYRWQELVASEKNG